MSISTFSLKHLDAAAENKADELKCAPAKILHGPEGSCRVRLTIITDYLKSIDPLLM